MYNVLLGLNSVMQNSSVLVKVNCVAQLVEPIEASEERGLFETSSYSTQQYFIIVTDAHL